jgi:S-adenosylmethionine hydrolase
MKNKTFALMTDFGFDFAVASMKALILKELPGSQVIDVDHNIKQFSVISGAFVINKVYEYFPKGTIFVCVIDPGVGSKRKPIFLDFGNYRFVGPDNGLFYYLIKNSNDSFKSYSIKRDFKPVTSNTFHGRDLFTPAAIEIAKDNLDIIEPISTESLISIALLDKEESVITYIDSFGNIKTNIPFSVTFERDDFLKIKINNMVHNVKLVTTFSDVASGELLCYKGSNGTLEIAANLASASDILKVKVGDRIVIKK